jgi:hypothetical protein
MRVIETNDFYHLMGFYASYTNCSAIVLKPSFDLATYPLDLLFTHNLCPKCFTFQTIVRIKSELNERR